MAKNWALFLLVSVLILGGWIYLEHVLTPVPQRKEEEAKKETPKKNEAEKKKPKPKKKPEKAKAPPPKAPSTFKPEIVTLGEASEESKYHLQVQLTTRGGGVQGVILNKFREADSDGREVPGELLHLVPSDPELPSNLLFHFGNPDEKDRRPLTTLGQQKWEIVPPGKQTKEGVQQVTFRTEIKGLNLRLSKTYELAPGTYHLGLSIQIEDTRKKGEEARRFRYQLAGAHGLPIEGKWYTNVFRNALIGIVDNRGTLQRSVEDSRRISVRAGGERVPEVNNNLPIQYAGVVTQFFGSVIVVDNTGADKTVPPKILEWARPTLESTEIKGRIVSLNRKEKRFVLRDEDEKELHQFVLAKNGTVHLNSENDQFDDLQAGQPVFVRFYFGENRPLPGGKGVLQVARAIHSSDDPHKPQFDDISVRVNTTPIKLKPGETTTHKYLLYNGPVKVRLLGQFTGIKEVPSELVNRYENDLHLNTLTDYHSDSWFGWFANKIFWTDLLIFCTNLMHSLLNWLHWIIPSYGICIILLTVIVRGLMFPVSRKQALLSVRMQELAPELKKVQEKYKNDPQGRTHATMDLYRKHGVNPLGGCLPLIMQMPVFLGLYYCLQESIFFRLASFLWIDNLAAPDMLFRWGDGIPIISSPSNMGGLGYLGPYFNLLPVLAVTLMIMQQKMLTPPPTDEQQATQQKIMKYMMVVIGIMFYKVAAGLCIYFTASSLWGLAERKLLPKRKTAAGASPTPPAGSATKPVPRPSPKPRKPAPQKKPETDGAFQKVRNWWAEVLKQAKKK